MSNFVLIDSNSLVYKAYYALPLLTNNEGLYTNGIYGYTVMLFKILEDYKPDYIAAVFDMKAPTFRHKEYDQYKANRKGMPDELAQQLPHLKEVIKAFNIPIVEIEGYEADDIIGTIAKRVESAENHVYIVTGDRDSLQLVTNNITSVISKKGTTDVDLYTPEEVFRKFGVTPEQITDFKGLVGDKSDNIPGVPGIGEKTAAALLSEYKSIENLLNNLDDIKKPRIRELIKNNVDKAVLSKKLATIEVNIPLEINLDEFKAGSWDSRTLRDLFIRLGFKSLMNKLPGKEIKRQDANIYVKKLTDLVKLKEQISNNRVALDYIVENGMLLCIALYDGKTCFYVPFMGKQDALLTEMKCILEDEDIKKDTYNIKELMTYLGRRSIELKGVVFDAAIAAYLINSIDSEYSISTLARDYGNLNAQDEYELLGKGKNKKSFKDIEESTIIDYISRRVYAIYNIKGKMLERLDKDGSIELYKKIELPLIEVLSRMEQIGFKIDKNGVLELAKEFDGEIDEITQEIYQIAGEEFNINSTKQLGYILFDKLKLPVIKKTKTGYSTDAEVLDELSSQNEIVEKILRYRSLVKLRSTYISGILRLIDEDGSLHTTFMQTVTSTGRISSTEPNLQNIPVRDELGRRIRKVFIPRSENFLIMSADYSQIELRVLAHLSGDKNMINSFINNEDIHARTASEVFNVPIEDVTPQMRRSAKAVNFGIVYGISDFGLARDLKISRKEAQEYIDNYFKRYPDVKNFLDECIIKARENGYVTTIYNRRRYVPEINSKNYNVRSFGERVSMNTPIQGSAADIIKAAMVKVYNELRSQNLKTRLLLQVHDELILDVYKEELDVVNKLVKDCMENVIKLNVPLIVDINIGKNWYDAK